MQRLQQGASFLKIKLPYAPAKLRAFADKLIAKNKMPDSLLRLSLSRGMGTLGYSPKNANQPTLVMSLRPAVKINSKAPLRWNLVTSSFHLPTNEPLARFKTANKLSQVLARAEADTVGANEALLLNTNGFVVEGTSSNLFWIKRGTIYTPSLAAGILPGVTRSVVLEIAAKLKIPIREKNIRLKELYQAEGIFLSLSSLGIVEAKSLDKKELKKSPLTAHIASSYTDILEDSCACNLESET